MTPFQRKVQDLIDACEKREGLGMSGRELSLKLGKSRNHISQIMNDGLIPSGDMLQRLVRTLGGTLEDRRELALHAMRAKSVARTRDTYWLREALAAIADVERRLAWAEDFVATRGLLREYGDWKVERRAEQERREAEERRKESEAKRARAESRSKKAKAAGADEAPTAG